MYLNSTIKKRNRGFSLVELLVVITIIAIISGLLVPSLVKHLEKARRSQDVQYSKEIRDAFEVTMAETLYEIGQPQTTLVIDHSTTVNNPATCVADAAFWQLGGVPVSNTDKDYYWYIVYDPSQGSVSEIKLTTGPGATPLHELYPDSTAFMNLDD